MTSSGESGGSKERDETLAGAGRQSTIQRIARSEPHTRPADCHSARRGDGCPRTRRSLAPDGRGHTPTAEGLVTRRRTASGDSCASAPSTASAGASCVRVSNLVPSRYERCVRIAQAAPSRRRGGVARWHGGRGPSPLCGHVRRATGRCRNHGSFRACAKLMHGRPDHLFEDALIAATAIVHHLVVVTRNVRHFTAFQVDTLDPFATK